MDEIGKFISFLIFSVVAIFLLLGILVFVIIMPIEVTGLTGVAFMIWRMVSKAQAKAKADRREKWLQVTAYCDRVLIPRRDDG